MLVTVALIAGGNLGVSTPIGALRPGDAPISQVVRSPRIEQVSNDLAALEAQGLISFIISDDPTTDDRGQIVTRNAQSGSVAGAGATEFQGVDLTFYVPLATTGSASASDIVVVAPGTFRGKQLRILDCFTVTTTQQAGGACQLFDTAAGGGTALSASMAMTAAGQVRNTTTAALGLMSKTKGLFVNRVHGNAVGECVIWARAEY